MAPGHVKCASFDINSFYWVLTILMLEIREMIKIFVE